MNYNYNDHTGIYRSNLVPTQEKHVVKLERIQGIANKIVPDLEDLTYKERLIEIHLTTLTERRKRVT